MMQVIDPHANAKQRAAAAAMEFVKDNMVVGLGTGSTADFFLRALASAIQAGRLRGIRGVPTSLQSEARAIELGIAVAGLADCPLTDVTIDGADEIAPDLSLIKGLGGALLREKIVAQNTRRLIIIADAHKMVKKLGLQSPLPVEVIRFGHEIQPRFLRSLGAAPTLRMAGDAPFITDNGNFIYDCRFSGIDDPAVLEAALRGRAGVVCTGLFLNLVDTILIGSAGGVEKRQRGTGAV